MRRRIVATLTAMSLLASLGAPTASADISLSESGAGALGKLNTFKITGTPGEQYLLILSLVPGPTVINPSLSLDVGLELVHLSFTIPGLLGTIPGSGEALVFLPFPADITLDPLTIHWQAVRHDGVVMLEKSNPCKTTFNLPLFPEKTLGDMPIQRGAHQVVEQAGGKLLFIGGGPDGVVTNVGQKSMELYDPCTQTFDFVGDLVRGRVLHTATELNDGRILIVGGADDVTGEPTAACEIVDPSNGYSTTLTANSLSEPRAIHTATLLPDGRVLVAGGTNLFNNSPQDLVENATATTELFNPVTNMFSPGPPMPQPRVGHAATILPNDDVLISGGFSWILVFGFKVPTITDQAQRYVPDAGIGTLGAQITMTSDRFGHTAAVKDNGNVLLFGGAKDQFADPFNPLFLNTVEEFNPVTNTFTAHGNLTVARGIAAIAKLPGDIFVAAGGANGGLAIPIPNDTLDIYNGTFGTIQFTIQMSHVRALLTVNRLDNGAILLAGGGEEGPVVSPNNFDDAELLTLP